MERAIRKKPRTEEQSDRRAKRSQTEEPKEKTIVDRRHLRRTPKRSEGKIESEWYTPRGMKIHERKTFSATVYFQRLHYKHTDDEHRWYYLGKVRVAYVVKYLTSDVVKVRMNSLWGNGSEEFENIKDAERFIMQELKGVPKP